MEALTQEGDVARLVGGVAGPHQGLGGDGRLIAGEDGAAAGIELPLGAAVAEWHESDSV